MPPVEEWETFPFEGVIRPRALQPPAEDEKRRHGEGGVDCHACAKTDGRLIWEDEHWQLTRDRPDRAAAGLDPRAEGALRHRDAAGRAGGGDGAADAADRARHAGGRRHRPRSHRPLGRRQRAPALVVHGAAGPDAAAERQLRGDLGRHPSAASRGRLAENVEIVRRDSPSAPASPPCRGSRRQQAPLLPAEIGDEEALPTAGRPSRVEDQQVRSVRRECLDRLAGTRLRLCVATS